MQTKAMSEKQLLALRAGSARESGRRGWRAGSSAEGALSLPVVAGALLLMAAAAAGAGYLLGAIGVAAVTALAAAAASAASGWLMAEARRNAAELDRLVRGLAQSDKVGLAHYRLTRPWLFIAQKLIESHSSLLAQLQQLQGAAQKCEVALRVAQAAQRHAEAIVNSLSDAVLVTNSFGEILFANPEAERLFRFELDTVRGKPLREEIAQDAVVHLVEQAIRRGVQARRLSEEISLTPNGKQHWYKAVTAGVTENGTEQLGVVVVLREVTAEKAAQRRSAEFVSAVSHEIKTPLTSVKAYAEMLADEEAESDPATRQKFLGIIESQTDRMTRMLESMLDMARIESGVVRVEKKPIPLNELLEAGARLMQPAAADKNITIEARLSSLYLGVEADADMMSRVVMNLVSNAIKYTDAGGRVVLRSHLEQDQASFEVSDSGHGIPPEAMARLFQKFYRVEQNNKFAPGTGLGLALVKHIVEEVHGGKVEVESEVGKGSTFRVLLPLHRTS